jgi:Spy/CpxP family protein refolding chaperone
MKVFRIIIMLFVISFCAGAAYAQPAFGPGPGPGPDMPMMKWWLQSDIVKELKLTDDQVKKIDAISRKGRREDIKMKSRLDLARTDLDDAMDASEIDATKVKALIDEFVALHADFEKHKMLTMLEVRQVLTRDQHLKLKEMFMQKMKMHDEDVQRGTTKYRPACSSPRP